MKVLLASVASATFACGGNSASTPHWSRNPGGTIAFEPTLVDMSRTSHVCGVMNPPFMNGDIYSADLVDQTGPRPHNGLSVTFSSPAPTIGKPHMLAVGTFMPSESATTFASQNADGDGILFSYSQGSDPGEIDAGAYDAVTVTILAMPTDNGQPLTVSIQMHFVDGKVLNETFSNLLVTGLVGCAAG